MLYQCPRCSSDDLAVKGLVLLCRGCGAELSRDGSTLLRDEHDGNVDSPPAS